MIDTMKYKDYIGSVEFSEEDKVLHGKVLGIRSLISYEGTNVQELITDFHNAVDDYLLLCKESGDKPEKSYLGNFNVRITPELHQRCALFAIKHNITLNSFVKQSLEFALDNIK